MTERARASLRAQPGRETHHFCRPGGKSAKKRSIVSVGPRGAGALQWLLTHLGIPLLGWVGEQPLPQEETPAGIGAGGRLQAEPSPPPARKQGPLSFCAASLPTATLTDMRAHTRTCAHAHPHACGCDSRASGPRGRTHCATLSPTLGIRVPRTQPLHPSQNLAGAPISSREVG